MNLGPLLPLIEVAQTLATVIGILLGALGTIWAFFHKKISSWWRPYRTAIDAMADIPGIKDSVEKSRGEIQAVSTRLALMVMTVRARTDNNVDAAEFESDADGAHTYANLTYARWLGISKNELLGWGWINYVHPEDQPRIRQEWDRCRAEHRVYRQRHRLVTAAGGILNVETLCTPIPEAPPAHNWVGIIRQLEQ